jgi:glycosyltransferase involved in cell wall biosynthesis
MSAAAKLTVAFVNSIRPWGGVKTWTLDFGRALQARGHRVIAVARTGTAFDDACRRAGFHVVPARFGFRYNPVAISRLVRVFRRERPSIAIANISKDLNVGAVAARLTGIPVIHRVGHVLDFRGTVQERLLHRFLVHRIVVPSEHLRDQLLRELPWLVDSELAVIPNSKQPEDYPLLDEDRDSADCFVLGVSSRLHRGKGHSYLFQALALLVSRGYHIRLRIAGEGALGAALAREATQRGLSDVVEFCGFQRDIPAFLAGLDCFVLPSLNESFGNTALEAMWAGLPIVAFRAGGIPEVVGDTALLTPSGEIAALANAIERLIRDPQLRHRIAQAARRRAEECFDVTRNVERFEALIRDVMSARTTLPRGRAHDEAAVMDLPRS